MKWASVSFSAFLAVTTLHAAAAPVLLTPAEVARQFDQRVWTHEHGLPDDRVKAIAQTPDGYLWLATPRGLARFDGSRFVVFNRLNTPQMINEDCRALTVDPEGRLWIGTPGAVLCLSHHRFIRFDGQDAPLSLPLCASRSAGLWTAGNACLCQIRDQQIHCHPVSHPLLSAPETVMALNEDAEGTVWTATLLGLGRYHPQQKQFELAAQQTWFQRLPVTAIARDAQNRLWALFSEALPAPAFKGGKCWLGCFQNGAWVRSPDSAIEDFSADHWGSFITEDPSGSLWLPAGINGVHRFTAGRFEFLPLRSKQQEEVLVISAFCDRAGNMWFGTEASGLHRWTRRKVFTCSTLDGLPHDNVWSISPARAGGVWIGTDAGVIRFDGQRFVPLMRADNGSEKYVRSVVEDGSGAVWIGTMRTLQRVKEGSTSQVTLPGDWAETKIRVLLPARDGSLWIGSVRGLTRLQGDQRTKYTRADGLGSDDIRALLETRGGELWIGTYQGGLSRLRDGRLSAFTTADGLSDNNVWALHDDAEGRLWIGTENGLNCLQNGRFIRFTTANGLPHHQINCLVEDDSGRLWIGYDHGIYWIDKQQLTSGSASIGAVSYDQTDGLLSTEINGQKSNPAACKTSDGRLWFPTTKGIAVFDPRLVGNDRLPPAAAIEQVRANGEIIFANAAVEPPSTNAGVPEPLSLEARLALTAPAATVTPLRAGGGRVLEVRYTASAFVAPDKLRFRYRLAGLDDHWIEASNRREAYFTGLRPGNYRFEVMACNHHGIWPEHGATFAFHLAPFFYQTWWFYLATGITGASILALLGRWRLRELKRIHALEQTNALNEQRRQIARDIHDELGASLTHIVRLTEQTRKNLDRPEQLDAQTHRIAAVAEEAVDHIGEIVWANNPNYDTLQDLVSYLREHVANFLASAPLRVSLDFPQTVPDQTVSGLFRRHLLLLVKEALQNIVKHARATEVSVTLDIADHLATLIIRDNGIGLPVHSAEASGNGLANIRQRAAELGGVVRFTSSPGHGTEIHLSIPLRNSLSTGGQTFI